MKITLYTTHCPQCSILEKKLQQKNVSYEIIEDVTIMRKMGMLSVPNLVIDDGAPLNFKQAVEWVNSLEV